MNLDREQRLVDFKIYVASMDDSADRYLKAFDRTIGAPKRSLFQRLASWFSTPRHAGNQIAMLPVSLGGPQGWRTEFRLCTVTFPSTEGARLLVFKGSDGLLLVVGSDEHGRALIDRMKHLLEQHGLAWADLPRAVFLTGGGDTLAQAPWLADMPVTRGDLETGEGVPAALKPLARNLLERLAPPS